MRNRSPRFVVLLIAGIVVAAAAMFVEIAESVRESETVVRVDHHVYRFVLAHRSAWLTSIAKVVTQFGSTVAATIVVVLVAAFLLSRRRVVDAAFVVCSSLGTGLLVSIVKHVVGRPRPPLAHRLVHATGDAFPSGHAGQSVACWVAVAIDGAALVRARRVQFALYIGAIVLALAIGASRVYLGVHWTSDVVCGWLLASGWLLALTGARFVVTGPGRRGGDDQSVRSGNT